MDLRPSELRVLERAVRRRFTLSDKTFVEMPAQLEKLATGKGQAPRTRIAAARVLVAMHAANLEQDRRDEHIPEIVEHRIRLIEVTTHASADGSTGRNPAAELPPGPTARLAE